MAGRGHGPDFVEALARGLDVVRALEAGRLTLAEVAAAADLARPTARRLLLTLEELGYVRVRDSTYELTPRVLALGLAYVGAQGLWEVAQPHLEDLVARTGESSSMAQLDGSDIVYVARVSVPKIIALRVEIGTRFPAAQTSQGTVLLAALPLAELAGALAQPSRGRGPSSAPRAAGRGSVRCTAAGRPGSAEQGQPRRSRVAARRAAPCPGRSAPRGSGCRSRRAGR